MLIPVVLSGGAGAHLWPVSREGQPKPFMRLPDSQTLLGKTCRRATGPLVGHGGIVTVINRGHYFQSKDRFQATRLGRHREHSILEPTGRGTAPAIVVAALALQAEHGNATVLMVMPADHLIRNEEAFCEAMRHAVRLIVTGHLVAFGMISDAAETGLNHIELGNRLDEQGTAEVCRLVERPDEETARRYMENGDFLWNSGTFCFTASILADELMQHAPALLGQARTCLTVSVAVRIADGTQHELAGEAFAALPDISIDYALTGRSVRVVVMPAAFGWSDISS